MPQDSRGSFERSSCPCHTWTNGSRTSAEPGWGHRRSPGGEREWCEETPSRGEGKAAGAEAGGALLRGPEGLGLGPPEPLTLGSPVQ